MAVVYPKKEGFSTRRDHNIILFSISNRVLYVRDDSLRYARAIIILSVNDVNIRQGGRTEQNWPNADGVDSLLVSFQLHKAPRQVLPAPSPSQPRLTFNNILIETIVQSILIYSHILNKTRHFVPSPQFFLLCYRNNLLLYAHTYFAIALLQNHIYLVSF
jgi:hypothetical protein